MQYNGLIEEKHAFSRLTRNGYNTDKPPLFYHRSRNDKEAPIEKPSAFISTIRATIPQDLITFAGILTTELKTRHMIAKIEQLLSEVEAMTANSAEELEALRIK